MRRIYLYLLWCLLPFILLRKCEGIDTDSNFLFNTFIDVDVMLFRIALETLDLKNVNLNYRRMVRFTLNFSLKTTAIWGAN